MTAGGPEPAAPNRTNGAVEFDVARQRELVEEQRAELGRTIEALAGKVDVPARAKAAAASARARLGATSRRYADPEYLLAAVAAVCTAISVVAFTSWWRARRQLTDPARQ